MKGVGEVPVEETQLAKFAGVQDRLRTWRDDVLDKVMHFSCIQIAMLDIDGFRMDKAAQTPIDVHAKWSNHQRACAKRFNKVATFSCSSIAGAKLFTRKTFSLLVRSSAKYPTLPL